MSRQWMPAPAALSVAGALLAALLLSQVSLFEAAAAGTRPMTCLNGGLPKAGEDGAMFCECLPKPTALEPNFYRGPRCEVPAVMCADSEDYYCANGATCREVVEGEEYRCEGCERFSGEHCDVAGMPCGSHGLYCFNGASCNEWEGKCECPEAWSGNANCTLPPADAEDALAPLEPPLDDDDMAESWIPAVVVVVLLAVFGGLAYMGYYYKWRRSPSRFFELGDDEEDHEAQVGLQEDEHGRL